MIAKLRIVRGVSALRKSANFRNGILYTLFSFLNNGISFILLLLLAEFIAPADYGRLNLFNTFVTLLSIFISLSTTSYVGVAFFRKSRSDLRKIVFVALLTTTGMLFLFSVVVALFPEMFQRVVGIETKYLWIALFICYFQVFTNLNLDIWRLEEQPVRYGVFSMSIAVLNFLFTLGLVVALHKGWQGRVYAQGGIAALFFIVSILFLVRRKYLVFSWPGRAMFCETWAYALPLIPHLSSFWFKQGMDRYIINYFHAQEAVGLFSFAMNFGSIIGMVGTAFNATNSVYIFKKLSGGYEEARYVLRKQHNIMTVVFLGLTFFIWGTVALFLPRLMPDYAGSVRYLFPVCMTAFFQCIYLLYVNYLFFYKHTRRLMYITVSTACVQVGLSLWLTRYDVLWTAYISAFVSLVMTMLVIVSSKRILKREGKTAMSFP